MRITEKMLKKIIAEEIARANSDKQRLKEGTRQNPIRITPEYINRLIREEYAAYQNTKRLIEARRRRRLAEARRRRRLAEAKRKETTYYY